MPTESEQMCQMLAHSVVGFPACLACDMKIWHLQTLRALIGLQCGGEKKSHEGYQVYLKKEKTAIDREVQLFLALFPSMNNYLCQFTSEH